MMRRTNEIVQHVTRLPLPDVPLWPIPILILTVID